MISNLCKKAIEQGGDIFPLIVSSEFKTGLLNPSIYYDDKTGDLLLNIRHVQYVLYHSENNQYFQSKWGPLTYLHPEHDQTLTTVNYFGKFTDDKIEVSKVDTSKLDVKPLWEFVGLEDARVVIWDGITWLCGVRRDTTTNGQGRMEMSKIEYQDGTYKETERYRLDTPDSSPTYCEKNWMPINSKPYHFIKWSNPVEIVKINLDEKAENGLQKCEQVFLSKNTKPFPRDIRGGSNVINWKDGYLMLTHEVDLFNSELNNKDAFYYHRFIFLNKDFEVEKASDYFNFMTGNIEFATGLACKDDEIFITFGFQDNSAYLLKTNSNFIEDILEPVDSNESEEIKNYDVSSAESLFKNEYISACKTPSDINEHLPILNILAKGCNHVTELGVRDGKSTRAFLHSGVILRSYDLYLDNNVEELFKIAKLNKYDVEYIKGDSTKIDIEETDLLFIDTWHCYDQLKKELNRHHTKVKKYIVFHDTHSFGVNGENYNSGDNQISKDIENNHMGILPAIIEFMIQNPEWKFHLHKKNNNGLTVIKKGE